MRRGRKGVCLLLWLLAAGLGLRAESADYGLSQNGSAVGTARCTIAAEAGGYRVQSLVRLALGGLNYALSAEQKLDQNYAPRQAMVSATVNGTAATAGLMRTGGELELTLAAGGRRTSSRFAAAPGTVLWADFDPCALELLLRLAARPHGAGLAVLLPKQTGLLEPMTVATLADEAGQLDGRPIVVHHLRANFAGSHAELFAGTDNRLLQAELPQPGFALVRQGFVLEPPTKAGAPPSK